MLCSEQAIVFFSENSETLARSRFQPPLIQDLDATSVVSDETALLKLLGSLGDASAAHAQHMAEELLGKLKIIRVNAVLRLQQPACQALF